MAGSAAPRQTAAQWDAVDAAVHAESAAAFASLEALVAAPSTVGAGRLRGGDQRHG
jgi:hypothetical protein